MATFAQQQSIQVQTRRLSPTEQARVIETIKGFHLADAECTIDDIQLIDAIEGNTIVGTMAILSVTNIEDGSSFTGNLCQDDYDNMYHEALAIGRWYVDTINGFAPVFGYESPMILSPHVTKSFLGDLTEESIWSPYEEVIGMVEEIVYEVIPTTYTVLEYDPFWGEYNYVTYVA
jgi:hypothetical protein